MKVGRLSVLLVLLGLPVLPQEETRHEGYAPLENFVGSWTIPGREGTYLETCDWYQGRHHIICNTEASRDDGSISYSMSILSFVPGQGYVYTGIGSRGRYETHQGGTFTDGVLEYLDRADEGMIRIRVGPFVGEAIPFQVQTSIDGTEWQEAESFSYIRAR